MELKRREPEEALAKLALEVTQARQSRDAAYLERNCCVAAMAHMALLLGWKVGLRKTRIEGWEPEWDNCCWIDFPGGQASWHYHDDDAGLFIGLPEYTEPWDTHSTEEKYQRIHEWVAGEKPVEDAWERGRKVGFREGREYEDLLVRACMV